MVAVADQVLDEIEHLWLEWHEIAVAAQFAPVCVQGKVLEQIMQGCDPKCEGYPRLEQLLKSKPALSVNEGLLKAIARSMR